MNTKFTFNLQLFAEEGASPAPADTTTATGSDVTGGDGGDFQGAPTETEPSPSSSDGPSAENAPVVRAGGLEIVIDEKTGRKLVRNVAVQEKPAAEEDATPAETQNEPPAEEKPQGLTNTPIADQSGSKTNVVQYTPQEFTLALQLGSVDESRIPAAYMPQYNQIKAQQQVIQQQQQQQAQGTEQDQQQVEAQVKNSMKDFYLKINNAAKDKAMTDAGFASDEEIEMAEYSNEPEDQEKLTVYKNALDWHKGQLMAEVQRRANEKAVVKEQQASLYRDIVNFTNDAKTKEVNFDAIDVMMQTHYKTFAYEQAKPIAETLEAFANGTITAEQCKVMEKYYNDTRIAYYAQKNNLSTKPVAKPPIVEKPGTGQTVPSKTDFKELRGLSPRERQVWMKNYFSKK